MDARVAYWESLGFDQDTTIGLSACSEQSWWPEPYGTEDEPFPSIEIPNNAQCIAAIECAAHTMCDDYEMAPDWSFKDACGGCGTGLCAGMATWNWEGSPFASGALFKTAFEEVPVYDTTYEPPRQTGTETTQAVQYIGPPAPPASPASRGTTPSETA
jgi:hypothetical protein